MATYECSTDNFTEAVAKIVLAFKKENFPGIGKFKATCHDGSTIVIVLRDKPPKKLPR